MKWFMCLWVLRKEKFKVLENKLKRKLIIST